MTDFERQWGTTSETVVEPRGRATDKKDYSFVIRSLFVRYSFVIRSFVIIIKMNLNGVGRGWR